MADTDQALMLAKINAELARRGLPPREGAATPAASGPAPVAQVAPLDPMTAAQDPLAIPAPAPGEALPSGGIVERAIGDITEGIATEGFGAVVRGVGGAIKETGDLVQETIAGGHAARDKLLEGASATTKTLASDTSGAIVEPIAHGVAWIGEKVKGLYAERESVTGNLIEGISQFATGMLGASKFIALPKAVTGKMGGKMLQGMVRGAAVDATVFDGVDARLSNLAEEFPAFQNVVTDYLASKPTDSQAEGRFKNAIEGLVIGPAAELLFAVTKARKLFSGGDTKAATTAMQDAEAIMERLRQGPEAEQVALKSLDPSNGVDAAGKSIKPVEKEVMQEGVPKAALVDDTIKPAEAAPYSTDLPLPKDGRGPIEFKYGDIAPNMSPKDAEKAVMGLQSRFAVAGKHMADDGVDFNFRSIHSEEDLKASLNALSAANEKMMLRTKGGNADGVLTNRMLINKRDELAEMFNADPDHMMVALANDARSAQDLAARFQTYKMAMYAAVNDAADRAGAALVHIAGSPERAKASAEALHATMIASQMQAMVKGIQTNTARTVASGRIATPSDLLKNGIGDYTELAKRLQEGSFHTDDEKLLRHLVSMKNNPKGFVKYMDKTFGGKVSGAMQEWYINALLSGPKTHVANFIGNVTMTAYMPLERAVAGMMPGSGKSTVEVVTRLKDEYDGLVMSLMDSFQIAGKALKQNGAVLDPGNGTHLDPSGRNVGGLSARALGATTDHYDRMGNLIRTETTPVLSAMLDGIQSVVGIPGRLLTSGDELFKQLNYRSYLYTEASQAARERGLKPGTPEHANYVGQEMTRGFDTNGVATNMEGRQVSREATFTQDLEYGVGRWLQGATNDNPWMKSVVPFVRTPTNLFRFAWKHTPLIQYAEQGFRADLHAGGPRQAKALAQIATGTAMWTAAVGLANSGAIVGGFSPNPEVRKGQEATGAKEYSIKVGDQYYQFNRMDPFATVFGMAADFSKIVSHMSEQEADKVAAAMTITLARNLASKTYVQGLTNAFNAVGDAMSGRSLLGLDSFAYRTAAGFVVPSIVNAAKGDDSLREARNLVDTVKARLPGYSKEVPPVRNILGEVVEAPKGLGPDFASPIGMGTNKKDIVYDELARQMTSSERPFSRIIPTLGETKIDLREIKLASGQNAYDRMQQLLWNTGIKDVLRKEFSAPRWNDGSMQDSGLDYPSAPGSKMWVTGLLMQKHKEVARNQLLAENPDLNALYLAELTRAKTSGVTGEQPRAYHPPKLLESLTGKRN